MSWGAVIVAGGSLINGALSRNAAGDAADAQSAGIDRAIDANREAYDESIGYLNPRIDQERGAMDRVNALLGLSGEAPDYSTFRDSPGYQFQLDQGQQAIERSAAARGGLQSGNTLAAVSEYGQGLADRTFNNYLAQVMGLSQQGADRAAAQLTTDRGAREGGYLTGQGDVNASGIVGGNNAWSSGIEGAAQAAGNVDWSSVFKREQPPSTGYGSSYDNNDYWTNQAALYGG